MVLMEERIQRMLLSVILSLLLNQTSHADGSLSRSSLIEYHWTVIREAVQNGNNMMPYKVTSV